MKIYRKYNKDTQSYPEGTIEKLSNQGTYEKAFYSIVKTEQLTLSDDEINVYDKEGHFVGSYGDEEFNLVDYTIHIERDKTVHEIILDHFVGKNEPRKWMEKPFNFNGKTMATDAMAIVSVPQIEGHEAPPINVGSVIPSPNMDFILSVEEISEKLTTFPMEVKYRKGIPVVTRNFEIGKGFKIKECVFSPTLIKKLVFVADKLKAKEVHLIAQSQYNKACLFSIKEVEVLLMPILCEDEKNIIQAIN